MVNIVSKFQVPSSNGLGVMMFWRYFHKGWLSQQMSNGAVCRTAPATPGLLITVIKRASIMTPLKSESLTNYYPGTWGPGWRILVNLVLIGWLKVIHTNQFYICERTKVLFTLNIFFFFHHSNCIIGVFLIVPIGVYLISCIKSNRHNDFCLFNRPDFFFFVALRVPPLDSEMGWTGELWSNSVFLILEN